MNTTKNILIFYTIVIICLLISCSGIYLYDTIAGIYALSAILTIIPVVTILSIIITALKKQKSKK